MANLPGIRTDIETKFSNPDEHVWNSKRYSHENKSKIYGVFLCNDTKNGIVYVDKRVITANDYPIKTHFNIADELGLYDWKISTGFRNPETDLKFYPKYVENDYKKLANLKNKIEVSDRVKYRAGRIWRHDAKTFVLCFWCEENKIDKKYLDIILEAFKIKSVFWCCVNSKHYYEYTLGETAVSVKSSEKLKSKVDPSLTQRQIIDILVKSHTSPNKLTPLEKKVVDEFRGSKEYADAKKGMGGYDIIAKYHYYSKTSEDCERLSFKDYIIEEALNYIFR
jgi:hypothetical protein